MWGIPYLIYSAIKLCKIGPSIIRFNNHVTYQRCIYIYISAMLELPE